MFNKSSNQKILQIKNILKSNKNLNKLMNQIYLKIYKTIQMKKTMSMSKNIFWL